MYRIFLLLLFTLCIGFYPNTSVAEFSKTKIAVLDFQLQGERFDNEDMGVIVAEWFITAMVREGRFDVVERRLLQKVIAEQKLAMTGVVDTDSATTLGKLLGVKVIITGSVMKLRDIMEINARIIDVESGSIITAENVKSRGTERLQNLVVEMSKKIIRNFPLEGYVVNKSGDSVTLDLGLVSGVKKDMRFIVYKEGQVIKHPKTGEVLDVERIETGVVSITQVLKNICTAKIVSETTPGSIDYGQLVKSLIEVRPQVSTLSVTTLPKDAQVRILNIVPKFTEKMELNPGPYHLEISAPGYQTIREWVTLNPREAKSVYYSLVASGSGAPPPARTYSSAPSQGYSAPPPPAPSSSGGSRMLSSKQQNYINQLESGSLSSKRDAAKRIARARLTDTVVLDVVEKELLNNYHKGTGRAQIDTMAWLCKALGASGNGKYRAALRTVAQNGPHRKLRGYAEKSLSQL